jgi:hypothetical protein
MQAMSMKEEVSISAQSRLLKHMALRPMTTDIDTVAVVAFSTIGLAATLYLLTCSSLSEAICAALSQNF